MTLIVTTGSPQAVLQVSDRRLVLVTSKGSIEEVATDEANKALIVKTPNAVLSIAFTGLAELEGVPTSHWIQDRISEAKAAADGFDACVTALRESATVAFEALTRSYRRRFPQTFVLAGFEDGNLRPRVSVITNCESAKFKPVETSGEFTEQRLVAEHALHTAGTTAALSSDAKSRIRGLSRRNATHEILAGLVVAEIRSASRHRKYGRYVGRECLSVWLHAGGARESMYHPPHSRPVTHVADLIDTFEAQGGGYGQLLVREPQIIYGGQGSPLQLGLGTGTLIKDQRLQRAVPPIDASRSERPAD